MFACFLTNLYLEILFLCPKFYWDILYSKEELMLGINKEIFPFTAETAQTCFPDLHTVLTKRQVSAVNGRIF